MEQMEQVEMGVRVAQYIIMMQPTYIFKLIVAGHIHVYYFINTC